MMYEIIAKIAERNISIMMHSDVTLLQQLGDHLLFDLGLTDKCGTPVTELSIRARTDDGKSKERFILRSDIHFWIEIED